MKFPESLQPRFTTRLASLQQKIEQLIMNDLNRITLTLSAATRHLPAALYSDDQVSDQCYIAMSMQANIGIAYGDLRPCLLAFKQN